MVINVLFLTKKQANVFHQKYYGIELVDLYFEKYSRY